MGNRCAPVLNYTSSCSCWVTTITRDARTLWHGWRQCGNKRWSPPDCCTMYNIWLAQRIYESLQQLDPGMISHTDVSWCSRVDIREIDAKDHKTDMTRWTIVDNDISSFSVKLIIFIIGGKMLRALRLTSKKAISRSNRERYMWGQSRGR